MPTELPDGLIEYSCDCEACKSMCHGNPCWGTPDEMQAIVDAGHGHKLCVVARSGSILPHGVWGKIRILQPATVAHVGTVEKKYSPYGRCAFLDEDNLCTLHSQGLKPVEGRVAIHNGGQKAEDREIDVRAVIERMFSERPEVVENWKEKYAKANV